MNYLVEFDGDARRLHGDIRLDGVDLDLIVGGALQAFDEELTVDGSPIIRLELLDPERVLVRSGIFEVDKDDEDKTARPVELVVDEVAYWLQQVNTSPDSDTVQVIFEDRTVAKLRAAEGKMRMRGGAGRDRDFIRALCSRAGVPEPITTDPDAREDAARRAARIGRKTKVKLDKDQDERDRKRRPGVGRDVRVTVKGQVATAEQLANMNEALSEAVRHNPTHGVLVAFVAMVTQESNWENSQGSGDDDVSWGLVQNIPGRSAGVNGTFTREQALDIAYSTKSALLPPGPTSAGGMIKYAREHPGISAGDLADATINGLGVGDPLYVPNVNRWVPEAERIVAAFTGGDLPLSSGATFTTTTTKETALTVEPDERYWDAGRRTADERNARFFVVANQPYYLYDNALMSSRPRFTIADPRHPDADPDRIDGVIGIGWEWAPYRQLRKTDLVINVKVKDMPPGSVVVLDETCGPAGIDPDGGRTAERRGRWLVGSYQRSRFEATARVTLIKGRKPKVPTATTTTSRTVGGGDTTTGVSFTAGKGAGIRLDNRYAGTQSIFEQFIHPFMARYGLSPGSQKRSTQLTASGNTSDHYAGNTTAYATDYPTTNGAAAAAGLAAAVGWSSYRSGPGQYDRFTFTVQGKRFSIQILWQSDEDHYDHVHVGVRVA